MKLSRPLHLQLRNAPPVHNRRFTPVLNRPRPPQPDQRMVELFRPREWIDPKPACTRWFPGHMAQGLKRMQMMARATDCILEIHDCRIPYTSRNHYANSSYGDKPRVLLLSKADLVDKAELDMVCARISSLEGIPVIPLTNTVHQLGKLRGIIKDGVSMAHADQLVARKSSYLFFVSGLPNSGKSSFINTFKKKSDQDKNKLRIGGEPGITKNISNKVRIFTAPNIYIYDTPGVNLPNPENVHSAMKLAVIAAIPAHVPGQVETADYLLYWLNRKGEHGYAEQSGLAGPSNNVVEVLAHFARKKDLMKKGRPRMKTAAEHFLRAFNLGLFGKVILEDV